MDITILGIESSCDDTSAAVLRGNVLLSNVIASQAVHVKYGGVIPELASRAHQQNIIPVVDTALKEAGITADDLDAIAFTRGPGLVGSLLVGVSFTKGLSIARNIPMVEVNHLQGHILSHFIDLPDRKLPHPDFPFLCLLVSGGHIARQQYDNQRALVRQYEGTVQSDKAAVDSAALQLQYSRITAPADGVLGLRKVDEGNMVHASDTEGLVRITLLTPSYVVFTLPESRVPLVAQHWREARKSGGRLLVQAWDREQQALLAQGFLLSMDNQIDTATGTVKLKAEFANEDHTLFPNQFVNARLLVTVLPQAVTVPTAAVQLGSRGSYVYVVDKDTVRLREVTPGVRTDSLTVIDKGLAAGEVVVVDGVDRLRDGLRVRVTASMETPRVTVPATGRGD